MQPRAGSTLLIVLVLVVVLGSGAAVIGVDADQPATGTGPALAQEQPEPDNTITAIELASDGTATWTITYRTRLATDEDLAEYERFQESFSEQPDRYLDPFAARMGGVVDRANDAHDREMRATEFTANTTIQEVPRRWGVVSFRFTWEGFAATEGDDVVVGDVFDGGFYIGEDDVLRLSAPAGFGVTDAHPTPDEVSDGVVEWHGREDFADRHPRVVATPSGDTATDTDSGIVGDRRGLVVVGGFAFGLLSVVVYAFRYGRLDLPGRGRNDDAGSGGDGAKGPTGDGSGAATAGGARSSPATGDENDGGDATGSDTLLTDEDRVRRTLHDHDGRMKQSAIGEELGWSKSKTSRTLSRMDDDGTVEKLRIGRENVIDLADDE